MKVVNVAEILAALDEEAAITAVETGFKRYSAGQTQVSTVLHLGFAEPPGDCHVKAAAVTGDEVFVVKLATSFYRNPEFNLPSSNGFMRSSQSSAMPLALQSTPANWRGTSFQSSPAFGVAKPGLRTQ